MPSSSAGPRVQCHGPATWLFDPGTCSSSAVTLAGTAGVVKNLRPGKRLPEGSCCLGAVDPDELVCVPVATQDLLVSDLSAGFPGGDGVLYCEGCAGRYGVLAETRGCRNMMAEGGCRQLRSAERLPGAPPDLCATCYVEELMEEKKRREEALGGLGGSFVFPTLGADGRGRRSTARGARSASRPSATRRIRGGLRRRSCRRISRRC